MSNAQKEHGKKQPAEIKKVAKKAVRKPYVIAIIPATVNYRKISKGTTKGIVVDSSVKTETVIYDYKKGVIFPDHINVEEIMLQRKITLIVPNDNTLKIGTEGSKKFIIAKKKTLVFFLRIGTDFWINPRIADGILLTQNIKFNSENSGNDGKELELSA